MHQKTMTSVPGVRERLNAPARYRRKTVGMVYSVPNSARLSSTPRPSSVLDHKWVNYLFLSLLPDEKIAIVLNICSPFLFKQSYV